MKILEKKCEKSIECLSRENLEKVILNLKVTEIKYFLFIAFDGAQTGACLTVNQKRFFSSTS